MQHPIHKWLTGLLDLLFPTLCAGCSLKLVQGESLICTICLNEFPETNYHLSSEDNPITHRFAAIAPIAHGMALYSLNKKSCLEKILYKMKYQHKPHIGTLLGQRYGYILAKEPFVETIDGIVSVPLHAKRLQERGYNQSDFFGQGLASYLPIPFYPTYLTRIRYTPSQTGKNKIERMQNLQHAFNVNHPDLVVNKHVLLVDDILTTGATLASCVQALCSQGAQAVSIATIAVVEQLFHFNGNSRL